MKLTWKILAGFAALVVVGYVIAILSLGSLVTSAVNRFGPRLAQTKVTLGAAQIFPLSGAGSLENLVVGNPSGWSSENAIAIGRIHVAVAPSSLFSNHVIVKNVEIDAPVFRYETRFLSTNIGTLERNIEGGKDRPENQPGTESGAARRFEIKHLVVKDGEIILAVPGTVSVVLDMPTFEFNDLGSSQGGVNSAELTALVARTLLQTVAKTAAGAVGKVAKTGLGATRDLLNALQGGK